MLLDLLKQLICACVRGEEGGQTLHTLEVSGGGHTMYLRHVVGVCQDGTWWEQIKTINDDQGNNS